LRADFPNGSPWVCDWAKFTDEGWYGNAAIRAHLFGNWYVAGDFNPAVAVPVWPFLEWLLFFSTGVTVEAARGLAVACFFLNLALSYLLLRCRVRRWIALLGVTLVATSPFLYCFSRLAILEPLQTTLTLAALLLAVRLPQRQRPVLGSIWIGLLFALIVLTKTTGFFLLPALLWAMVAALWQQRKPALRCALAMTAAALAAYGAWMALIASFGLLGDYKYYFFVNTYDKPKEFYWPLEAFWWSFHGLLWIDHSLILMAGAVVLAAAIAWRSPWGRKLVRDPLFGASLWAIAGYLLFMTLQNHPQPRYFAVPAFFCFFVVALGAGALLDRAGQPNLAGQPHPQGKPALTRALGWTVAIVAAAAAAVHGAQTIRYATHPEYTWVQATTQITLYMDTHPNGKRLLDSISGDEITLLSHVPSLCDDFGTEDLAPKLADYKPGWYASWNDLDPGTLEDLHTFYSLEQVASFPAFDDPGRNLLVLFKLHPLPAGRVRDPSQQNLRIALPDDKIDVAIE
jgi:predicted membrane-bound mannosyltransferase